MSTQELPGGSEREQLSPGQLARQGAELESVDLISDSSSNPEPGSRTE